MLFAFLNGISRIWSVYPFLLIRIKVKKNAESEKVIDSSELFSRTQYQSKHNLGHPIQCAPDQMIELLFKWMNLLMNHYLTVCLFFQLCEWNNETLIGTQVNWVDNAVSIRIENRVIVCLTNHLNEFVTVAITHRFYNQCLFCGSMI